MKIVVLAVLATLLLGAGAAVILARTQVPAYVAYTTSGARVSQPGHNLVGPNWSGQV